MKQRYLSVLLVAALSVFIASTIATFGVFAGTVRSPDETTGKVVASFAKGRLVGYVTATQHRIETWAKAGLILSMTGLVSCGVANRLGREKLQAEAPRPWD